jgi:hypothetical protein
MYRSGPGVLKNSIGPCIAVVPANRLCRKARQRHRSFSALGTAVVAQQVSATPAYLGLPTLG